MRRIIKSCTKLLTSCIICLLSLSLSLDTNAISGQVEASRLVYAISTQYATNPTWSEPVRYNEPLTYADLSASQMNTYPGFKPSGRNVNISGKMNISLLDRSNQYFPATFGLEDLTVVCGWGSVPLVTDGASVQVNKGNWEGTKNNIPVKVTYLDVTFNWSGHFNGDYNNVSSSDMLSCNVRRRSFSSNYNYYQFFARGTLNNTYVYADNSAFDSYLYYNTSDDADYNAIRGVQDAVVNLQNTIIQNNNYINEKDEQDRNNINQASDDADSSSSSAQAQAQQTGTTLLKAFSDFVGAITNASASDCVIDADLGNLDLGEIDLCQLALPAPFQVLASLTVIGFCVPLSIATARKLISLIRSFQ